MQTNPPTIHLLLRERLIQVTEEDEWGLSEAWCWLDSVEGSNVILVAAMMTQSYETEKTNMKLASLETLVSKYISFIKNAIVLKSTQFF